ncbi:unnamed protein product [Rotaria sordida]|uniref:Uncharacterized protein n=1 Tax=Rotaria sordida TaxID=392033 RepID=A0A818PYL9_9BILA|nr:unnamed protein product [Rotaria sordida]CAF3631147.1 unnamed protein product [Rotaria sordida]
MQPNPNRLGLENGGYLKSYDPSSPYRAMMMPPPPVNSNLPPSLPPINDQRNPSLTRIPQYYYPRYDGAYDTYLLEMREREPFLQPPDNSQPIQNEYIPYSQPTQLPVDPYGSGTYYPNSQPYVLPSSTNLPYENPGQYTQMRSNSDIISSHKKDADLSRLEVYHFTPKSAGINALPPVIQYHVYPYPPSSGLQSSQQQQGTGYFYSQNDRQSDVPYYISDQSQLPIPLIERKARSSQTDQPSTKTRGVSPIDFSNQRSIIDDDGYPHIYQKEVHTDRYNITTGRINRRFYDKNNSSTLPDCRCLDCQRERSKVLNYYPD